MKQTMLALIAVFLSSVCLAKAGESAIQNQKRSDPARLIVVGDTIVQGKILGWVIMGNDSVPDMIDIQDVIRDQRGNLLVTGAFWGTVFFADSSVTSRGLGDCFVARFAPSGKLLWLAIRGTRGDEIGYGITVDPDGRIYVAGAWDDTVSIHYCMQKAYLGTGGKDAFLLSFDPTGTYCRTKVIVAGKGNNGAFAVTTDIWSNVYVTGTFRSTAIVGSDTCTVSGDGTLGDVFMLKLSSDGQYLATRTYGTEYADERGVYIGISYVSTQVAIYFDINKALPDGSLGFLTIGEYGMEKSERAEICNLCAYLHFEELRQQLKKPANR